MLVAGLIIGSVMFVLWRTMRMGTVVHSDHVELRGLWSTMELSWRFVTHVGVIRSSDLDVIDGGPREAAVVRDRAGRQFYLPCVTDKDLRGRGRSLRDEVEMIRAAWQAALRRGDH
jgi:hypothetical protein